MTSPRVTLLISSLGCGGAERVALHIAQALAERDADTLLLTYNARPDFFAVPPGVRRVRAEVGCSSRRTIYRNLRQQLLELKPDVLVAFGFLSNMVARLLVAGTHIPLVLSEHVDPGFGYVPPLERLLRRAIYGHAKRVICVSHGIANALSWLAPDSRVVIYNPITPDRIQSPLPPFAERPKQIVAMGRLHPQKGFDLLIPAFVQASRMFPDWSLRIIGEGPDRPRLERLIRFNQMEHKISLPGITPTPMRELAKAQIFALSSRYEGFGNVLVEAMASGLAVVSTACPSGPAEIIRNGWNGLLVPQESVSALRDGMRHLMRDGELRERLAQAGLLRASDFSIDKATDLWCREIFAVIDEYHRSVGILDPS